MLFKNSVRTSKRTPHFTITKINWLTLFKEMIAVYSGNHKKSLNALCGQNSELLVSETSGTRIYHLDLRVKLLRPFVCPRTQNNTLTKKDYN
jgi:hypothetical protein